MKRYGLLAALLSISSSHAVEDPGFVVTYFDALQRLTLDGTAPTGQQKLRPASPFTLTFDALGQTFSLELEPNDSVLSRESREALSDEATLHRGRVTGKVGSWARIVMADGVPRGLIWDGEQMFAVEAPGDSAVRSPSPVIYRLADTYVTPGTMSCGASVAAGSASAMYSKLVGELAVARASAPGATSEIHLSAIGDFQFSQLHGPTANVAIATRLNNVDGIFSEQLGVQITVETVEVHSDADDPFTETLDSNALLDELSDYRFNTPLHRNNGLTHLYTGRNLDGTTVGIAFLNALCSPRFGAGLTEGRSGTAFDSLITAHEIGHNFGAPHDAEEDSACEAEPDTFLMAPSVNGSDQFSQCSMAQIQPRIANAACITALPTVDMTVSSAGSGSPVHLGNNVTVTFDVSNLGTVAATNVMVEVGLPEKVAFVSVESSVGSCSSGAGNVNCQLGTIEGGSNRTVTVTATTLETGEAPFNAWVFADVDNNAGNDEVAVPLTIIEVVDLVVNTLPITQVGVNQSTSISADLDNLSTLNATGVELSISFGQGLRADSATWSLGSCIVSAQRIDCESDNFAAQGSATVDFAVTGTAAGVQSYTVALSSTEEDANTADNSRNGTVTVTAATSDASSGGGGGGGSAGPLFLWLLTFAAILARIAQVTAPRATSRHRY
jgi:uncharacterized repeat protein (TIGR01451 family)